MSSKQLVWLVTGTSSGFGQRLVKSALGRGDYVIASARSLKKLEETLQKSPGNEEKLRLLELDVTSGFANIKHQIDAAVKIFGRIEVLVNNAAQVLLNTIEEGGTNCLREQFEVNVFGAIDTANAVIPYMRAQGSGTIVNIGSRSAWKPEIVGVGPYGSSKAALHALTETLALELAPFNIQVLLVAPGAFRTEGAYVYGEPWAKAELIPEYEAARGATSSRLAATRAVLKGDPDKAMEAVVDVVRGEGVASGRELPLYLILGDDAEVDIRAKLGKVGKALDEWVDVTRSLSLDTT
ncbi:hypothetical protein HGRIS_013845 [Hohenbuehelia grisea]